MPATVEITCIPVSSRVGEVGEKGLKGKADRGHARILHTGLRQVKTLLAEIRHQSEEGNKPSQNGAYDVKVVHFKSRHCRQLLLLLKGRLLLSTGEKKQGTETCLWGFEKYLDFQIFSQFEYCMKFQATIRFFC